jgi:hypothetical protein
MTREPEVSVNGWHAWKNSGLAYSTNFEWEREQEHQYAGAYVLGHFKDAPVANKDPHTDEGVFYIGMTEHLESRPRLRHEKIDEYRKRFADPSLEYLYIAVYAMLDCFRIRAPHSAYLRYLERKLIWEYAQIWGKLPLLNEF